VDGGGACLLVGFLYCGGMRQSILFNIVIVLTGMAAVGSIVMLTGKSNLPLSITAPSSASFPEATAKSLPSSAPSVDTSHWKVYQNNTYKFSFRYPSLLKERDVLPGGSVLYYLYACDKEVRQNNVIRCAKGGHAIRLSISDEAYDPENVLERYDAPIGTLPFEQITVGGRNAHVGANAAFNWEEWIVQIDLGNKTLFVSFSGDRYINSGNSVTSQEGLHKVKEILSTFEFK
jgi:hypothetical protein